MFWDLTPYFILVFSLGVVVGQLMSAKDIRRLLELTESFRSIAARAVDENTALKEKLK